MSDTDAYFAFLSYLYAGDARFQGHTAHPSTQTSSPYGPLLDFTGASGYSSLGGSMSSMSSGESGTGLGAFGMPAMGMTNSPLMMPGDESLLFSGGYGHQQHQQHQQQQQPPFQPPHVHPRIDTPNRSGSGSTPISTPSSAAHLQLGTPSGGSTASLVPPAAPQQGMGAGGNFNDALTDPALVEPHMQYYLDSVLPMQYVFTTEKANGVLRSVCTPSVNNKKEEE